MTKFKDVANFYKGVPMQTRMGVFPLVAYLNGNWWLDTFAYGAEAVEQDIKPLLRPLSDMNEEEKVKLLNLINQPIMYASGEFGLSTEGFWFIEQSSGATSVFEFTTYAVVYLLSINADIFNLIPSGEAIDASKTNS